jgi:glycosyltransferase involved in cell wall biosynthesis
MANDMAEHFQVPRDKLVRIYNPVDVKRVQELAEYGENPYSGPGPHLAAAGRLTRQKGFDVLLDALPAVLECFPETRLAILGEGPLEEKLTEQAQKLGLTQKVTFLGFQENPWPYLKHADLFLLPSRYEGTPNVLLEALALGTPVVASDCPGGMREIQASNPEIVLVPPEDPGALAQAIITASKMPRRAEGTQRVQQRLRAFDLQEIVDAYSQVLEQV